MAPLPRPGNHINVGDCLERKARGLVVFYGSDCTFSYGDYYEASRIVIDFLQTIERLDGINVVWPGSATCNRQNCVAEIGNTLLYLEGASHLRRFAHGSAIGKSLSRELEPTVV